MARAYSSRKREEKEKEKGLVNHQVRPILTLTLACGGIMVRDI